MNERATWSLLFFISLACATASAEPRTTKKIVVQLEGCDDVRSVSIVLGEEQGALRLQRAPNGLWTGTREAKSFDAASVVASLRVYPGRTTCRRALPYRSDENGKPVAVFVFNCASGSDYRMIELDLAQPLPVAYRRDVATSAIEKESVACIEDGAFVRKGRISDVDLDLEKVFIYPGLAKPDPMWPGILLSELAREARKQPVVKKLSRADLGELFMRQAAAGQASAPPSLSDNWRLRVEIALQQRGVEHVDVAVRK